MTIEENPAAAPTAVAQKAVTFKCEANAPVGADPRFDLDTTWTVSAPDTVARNATMTVTLNPAPLAVPATAGGRDLKEIRDVALKVDFSTNATFVSTAASGGTVAGTVARQGNIVTLTVRGPLAAGRTHDLPSIILKLKASGAAQSAITTRFHGTSLTNTGLTFTADPTGLVNNVPCRGFPHPNPVLSSTRIT